MGALFDSNLAIIFDKYVCFISNVEFGTLPSYANLFLLFGPLDASCK